MEDFDITSVDVKPTSITNIRANHTGASFGYSFYNATGTVVYVTTRNGIITKINPSFNSSLSGKFIIRYNLIFDKDENVTVPVNSEEEDVVKVFYDSFASSTESRYVGKRSMHYDNVIELNDINENDGALYLRNLDLLISLEKTVDVAIHPFSDLANKNRAIKRIRDAKSEYSNFSIRIVDNSGKLSTQFTKIAGNVYAINPIRDLKSKDGVYILENKLVNGASSKIKQNVKIHNLSEHRLESKERKEPIIFKRYEDALNFNDILEKEKMEYERSLNEFRKKEMEFREEELKYKQKEKEQDNLLKSKEMEFREEELKLRKELMEMEIRRKRDEEEIDKLKREHALAIAMEKNRLAEIEIELKKLQQKYAEAEIDHKIEMLKMKEDYESRSNLRKNITDVIKSTPTVIAGVAAIAAILYAKKE